MSGNAYRLTLLNMLQAQGITNITDQAKYLGLSYQAFKEYFLDGLETKESTKTVAKRTINSMIKNGENKLSEKLSTEHFSLAFSSFLNALEKNFKDEDIDILGIDKIFEGSLRDGERKPTEVLWRKILRGILTQKENEKKSLISNIINTLCVFEPIFPGKVEKTVWRVYKHPNGKEDPRILKLLSDKQGVYLLYDSTGGLVYVGKTEKQDFYKEISQRLRTKSIKIKFGTKGKKSVPLGEVVKYMTCYEVTILDLISKLESILIGLDPNSSSNVKMEK